MLYLATNEGIVAYNLKEQRREYSNLDFGKITTYKISLSIDES